MILRFAAFLALALAQAAVAAEHAKPPAPFTPEAFRARVAYLAGDELAGRYPAWGQIPMLLDEWNLHWYMVDGNDNEEGALYIAEALLALCRSQQDYAPFFEPKDGW